MARDRSGLKHRRRREPPSAAERAEFRADKIFSRDPKLPMTEAEEEEAFYQACEKWCGILLRVGFLAYSLFGLLAALFEWSTRPPMRFDPPGGLAGTNVVVTGGCDGIGLETARLLAGSGATVIVGCRPDHPDLEADPFLEPSEPASASSPPRADPYPMGFPSTGGSATRSPLNLADFASVRAFAADVVASLDGRVDALVHNAATPRACADTVDGFDVGLRRITSRPRFSTGSSSPPSPRRRRRRGQNHARHVRRRVPKAPGLPDTILDASERAARSNTDANRANRGRERCRPDAVYAESKRLLERHATVLARVGSRATGSSPTSSTPARLEPGSVSRETPVLPLGRASTPPRSSAGRSTPSPRARSAWARAASPARSRVPGDGGGGGGARRDVARDGTRRRSSVRRRRRGVHEGDGVRAR